MEKYPEGADTTGPFQLEGIAKRLEPSELPL